jgi:hypothetical protein
VSVALTWSSAGRGLEPRLLLQNWPSTTGYVRCARVDVSFKRDSYGMLHWKDRSLEEHIKVLKLPLDPPMLIR